MPEALDSTANGATFFRVLCHFKSLQAVMAPTVSFIRHSQSSDHRSPIHRAPHCIVKVTIKAWNIHLVRFDEIMLEIRRQTWAERQVLGSLFMCTLPYSEERRRVGLGNC